MKMNNDVVYTCRVEGERGLCSEIGKRGVVIIMCQLYVLRAFYVPIWLIILKINLTCSIESEPERIIAKDDFIPLLYLRRLIYYIFVK